MIYQLHQNILQALVSLLESLPSSQGRRLLNAIESECAKQDEEAAKTQAEAAQNALREKILHELADRLKTETESAA